MEDGKPLSYSPASGAFALASRVLEEGAKAYNRNLAFLTEELRLQCPAKAALATPNTVRLDLRTMVLREYGKPGWIPTLVHAPYAGHSAVIADYRDGQSLVQTLFASGNEHVVMTDWKSATPDMKDLEIDNYLAELVVAIDDLGGRVNLVGLCQGGWMSAMIAARFPEKVNSLVLAGAPIDADAGNGPLRRLVHTLPMSFYQALVAMGGGVMKGAFMLRGWKNMHPNERYFGDHLELYKNIENIAFLEKKERFDRWYQNPVDLPGRWYLQAIEQIFKNNAFAKGEFIALGRRIALRDIGCPVYLLAGADDDITPPGQVLDAANYISTAADKIVKRTVPGGHIGLFMGGVTLRDNWPEIGSWIRHQ